MQVGSHISVALKDQLILKIFYDKNLSLSYFFGCFAQKLSRKFVIFKPCYFTKHYNRNLATCLAGSFLFKIVDTRSFIKRFPRFATDLSQVVENSIAAALCQYLATCLLKTASQSKYVQNWNWPS